MANGDDSKEGLGKVVDSVVVKLTHRLVILIGIPVLLLLLNHGLGEMKEFNAMVRQMAMDHVEFNFRITALEKFYDLNSQPE